MPCYVYKCKKCGAVIEKLESYSAEKVQLCPECLTEDGLHRELAVSNFSFSGKGWAKDSYSN